jgi:hypothetical protein
VQAPYISSCSVAQIEPKLDFYFVTGGGGICKFAVLAR